MKNRKNTSLLYVSMFLASYLAMGQTEISKKSPEVLKIAETLDQWHQAAGDADFDTYFSFMAQDAIYIGTDATENWNMQEFKKFAKPYFEQGKAWNFSALDRNIYLSENKKTAWFDELLKTHMGICRGSGVLGKNNGEWKLKHYVLSVTIPNAQVEKVAQLKQDFDEKYREKLSTEEN